MKTFRLERDAAAALFFAGAALLLVLPPLLAGRAPFWGDLTYLHHPWRALPAQLIQSGRLPLWNPFVYFGMPMAASMQGASFYPMTLLFHLFGFPTALAMFHLFHYWLAGWLMYLWLRSLRLSTLACLAGGAAYALGGLMLSRMQFLNHLAVLSLAPSLLLFFGRPALLSLALGLAFLAGYPVFLPGLALSAWALRFVLKKPGDRAGLRRDAAGWLLAGFGAMAMTAFILLPALELAMDCRRSAGMGLAETLKWGFEPKDLAQWVSPLLSASFDPASGWWKCCYLGFAGWLAVGLGLRALTWKKAAGLALIFGVVAFLALGGSTPASLAVWKHLPALKHVRYPGNLTYLALPCLAILVAAGVEALRRSGPGRIQYGHVWAGLLALAVAAELSIYAFRAMPEAGRDLFSSPGPLVRKLQASLGGERYLLSPLALESNVGWGVRDWKWRLYGMTNAPFRLPSAGNFGEPLAPRGAYAFMDLLYNQPGAEYASRLFRWCGVSMLLTPGELPAAKKGELVHEGKTLWEIYRLGGISRAYWFGEAAGFALPEAIPDAMDAGRLSRLPLGRPVVLRRSREDRFVVEGAASEPGWVYAAEPFYPGWEAFLETGYSLEPVLPIRALSAFQKVRVPAGAFRLRFRYDPWTWKLGLCLTLASLMGFCLYWYNHLLRCR
ncbi:MAG: hypothetical protein HZB91_06485 [Elusimicrobia bacterium]|nr:hypothetical protein [Elusimicrobiota bacterium]